jgi:hypothetical protein
MLNQSGYMCIDQKHENQYSMKKVIAGLGTESSMCHCGAMPEMLPETGPRIRTKIVRFKL